MNKNFSSMAVNNKKTINNQSLENVINNIYQGLCDKVSESSKVVKEKLSRWSSATGSLSVYRKDDLKREKVGKFKARPIASFVFYPSIYDASKLGSVAIYGRDAAFYGEMLRKTSSLFGYGIKDVRTEMGLNLFVDVKFAA